MVSTSSTDGGGGSTDGGGGSTDGSPASAGREQPSRYERSTGGMVGALIVTLLVILAFVGFRALNRQNLDVKPEKVDYLAQVGYAQEAGSRVVYPARLPAGWYATQVTFTPPPQPGLELSMLTASGEYAGFVEASDSVSALLTKYVDPSPVSGGPVGVPGSVASGWTSWTDSGGDTALVAQLGSGANAESLLVFGTVSKADLQTLAASLTTARVKG